MLSYTAPDMARDALRWRHSTIPLAKARAEVLHLEGAAFPWRTIRGEECSGYWPAGTAASHLNAGVADAARRYIYTTGDEAFEAAEGLDLFIETARLWLSLGHHDAEGGFRIDGVTGPDEYTALIDNNVFTNLMAARNLRAAVHERPDAIRTGPPSSAWATTRSRRGSAPPTTMIIPFDDELGVHAAVQGLHPLRRWDFEKTPHESYPLLMHYPYYLLYSSQVVKQADLVFGSTPAAISSASSRSVAISPTTRPSPCATPRSRRASRQSWPRRWARWTSPTTTSARRPSSTCAISPRTPRTACTSPRWPGAGWSRWPASAVYAITATCCDFSPYLPDAITRLSFRLVYRERCLKVAMADGKVTYEVLSGEPLTIGHDGIEVTVAVDQPVVCDWDGQREAPTVVPPQGREPLRRGVGADSDAPVHRPA